MRIWNDINYHLRPEHQESAVCVQNDVKLRQKLAIYIQSSIVYEQRKDIIQIHGLGVWNDIKLLYCVCQIWHLSTAYNVSKA